MSSVLLKSDLVVTLDRNDQILKEGYLVVENDRIVEMGLQKDLDSRRKFDEVVALKDRLVMPGLVNAHTHTPMTLLRGHVEGHTLFTMDGWYNTIRVLELSQIESGSSEETQGNEDKSHPYYIGMDVHRAARIASTGHGGQVLLSETTRDLIYQDLPEGASLRDLGSLELKDIRYPQRIYELVIEGLPSEFPPLKTLSAQTEWLTLDIRLQTTAPPGENEVEAYESLLKRWRAQGRQALDKASLAILLGAPPEMTFEQDDLTWLLRGALQNELELEPWVKRASSPVDATHTLELLLREYPRPQARLAIVEMYMDEMRGYHENELPEESDYMSILYARR